MKDFSHLFVAGICEMYDAENQMVKALPELIHASTEEKLKEALQHHLEETTKQVMRLEEIADQLKIHLKGGSSPIMQELLRKEHHCTVANCPPEVKDAAIIAAAQCVEHYEIAMYGTLRAFAKVLKLKFAEERLEETLREEGEADKTLSSIAEGGLFTTGINKKACEEECS